MLSRPVAGDSPPRSLRYALLALAVLFPLVYLGIALLRIRYPFALEWLEACGLASAGRAATGQPLYVEPSLSFIPSNYTPLYYYVSVPFVRALGSGFLPLRLVSLLSSIGCFVLVFLLVRRATRDTYAAAISAALLAATYEMTGAWFDIARADSLYLFLHLAGFACLIFDRSPRRAPIMGGLVLGLAFLTKQSTLVASAPLLAYLLVARRSTGLLLAGTMAAVVLGTTLGFDRTSGGWYSFYVFGVAGAHAIHWSWLPYFWIRDAGRVGFALAVAIAYFILAPPRDPPGQKALFGWWGAGLFLSSWWLRLYGGGGPNCVMPATAAIAVLFGLGWAAIFGRLRSAGGPLVRATETLVYVACIMQFVGLGYFPLKYVPGRADVAAGESMVRFLHDQPGEVLVPFHSYLAELAGKPGHYHAMALADVMQNPRGEAAARIRQDLLEALRARRYSAIVLDAANRGLSDSAPGYEPSKPFFDDPDVFWTPCGSRTRPEFVLLPRKP